MKDTDELDDIYKKPDSELASLSPVELKDALFQAEHHKLKGLGGWLILVGIGVVITPFRLLMIISSTYLPLFKDGSWELLTDPASDSYYPNFDIVVIIEILGNSAFVLFSVYLIYLFFSKHYLFPKMYIVFIVANLVFIFADALLGSLVLDVAAFDAETIQAIVRPLISAFVWVPYLLVSKRVKVTFVEHKPNPQPSGYSVRH